MIKILLCENAIGESLIVCLCIIFTFFRPFLSSLLKLLNNLLSVVTAIAAPQVAQFVIQKNLCPTLGYVISIESQGKSRGHR